MECQKEDQDQEDASGSPPKQQSSELSDGLQDGVAAEGVNDGGDADDEDMVEISLAAYNIKCSFCSSAFTNQSDLRDHFATMHRINMDQVEKLMKDVEKTLKRKPMHMKGRGGRKKLPTDCKLCGRTFSTRKNLLKHNRTKHHLVKVQQQMAAEAHGKRLKKCNHCSFSASSARELTDHIKKSHSIICEDDAEQDVIVTPKRGRGRPRKIRPLVQPSAGNNIGTCHECGKQLKGKLLTAHITRCTAKKSIEKCSECGKAVVKKALYRHQRRCINKKRLVCPLCKHQSRERYDYTVHVNNHKTWLPADPGDLVPKSGVQGGDEQDQSNAGGGNLQSQAVNVESTDTKPVQVGEQATISTLDLSVLGLTPTPTAPLPGHPSHDTNDLKPFISGELLQGDTGGTSTSGDTKCKDEGMEKAEGTESLGHGAEGETQKNVHQKQLKCHSCDNWFQRTEFKHHMFSVHNLVKKFQCRLDNCMQTVTAIEQFLDHIKAHGDDSQFSCGCRNCLIRNANTDDPEYITMLKKQKLKEYYQGMEYKCDKCWVKFPTSEGLAKHNRKETHSHPCPVCGKVQVSKRQLRMHAVTHQDERNFLCEECGASFKTKRDLSKHHMSHSEFKPFVCQDCGKGFLFNNKLKRHRLTVHSNEKPFKCTVANCDKAFSRRDKLNDHARTHLYYEPFHCRFCPKGFFRKDNLKDHEVLHTKDYRFKCDRCPKGFMRPKLLARHIAHEHQVLDNSDRTYEENVGDGTNQLVEQQEQTLPMKLTKAKPKSRSKHKKSISPSTSSISTEAQTQNLSSQITYMIYQQAAGTSMAAALQQAMQSVNAGSDGCPVTLPAEVLQAYHLTQQATKDAHQGFQVTPVVAAEEQILPEALHDRTEFRLA